MEQQLEIDESLLERLCALLHVEPKRIKLNETFIRNGGDSLLAIKFSNLIRSSEHVHVGAGTILRANTVGSLLHKTRLTKLATGNLFQLSRNHSLPLVASNHIRHDHKTLDPIQRIPTVIPTSGLPLTFVQAGVAVMTHHVPGAAVQHVTQYCYTDILPQLREAYAKAMSCHQVFRLQFEVDTEPLLIKATLKESFQLNWMEQQVKCLEEADLEGSFRVWSVEASSEPVFRVVTPLKTSSERKLSVVHWFYHHSLMDGESINIFMQQVDAFLDGMSSSVEVNVCSFEVVRGLQDYHAPREAAAKAFWSTREIHGGVRNHPLLQALGDRTSSQVRMRYIDVFYPEDLKVFQSRLGFTFEILVRAAMGLVLSKLQGTSTVSLMSVSSRRSLPIKGIDQVVGSFATSMILTMDVNENDTAYDLLEQVFYKVLELEDMSYSDPPDGFSLGGLVVVSSDLRSHTPWYSGGFETKVMAPKETLPTLYVSPTGRVRFAYNSEWRSPSEMKVMTDLFGTAIINLGFGTSNVRGCLRNMLPISQKKRILEWGNCFATQTSSDGVEDDITSVFRKQALDRGDEAALQVGGRQISYKSLANMIRAVGRQLREQLEPRSVVLIHADGSVHWVVAMFAVLWADCIFSPQGVDLPHQLRSHHCAIAKAHAFLIPRENTETLTPDGCHLRLCVETILQDAKVDDELATRQPKPLSAAYICFSSGSTGRPKAIQCTHSGIVSMLRDPVARLHVEPGHRVAQTLAPSFDTALC